MTPTLAFWDYVVIGGYMLFALSIGFILSRRASESSDNYFLGGRSFPWWLVGISMIATSYASDTPLVVTEMIRQHGMQRLWWILSGCIGLSTAIILFSRLWRRAEITTDAEFYELRYSGKAAAFLRGYKALFNAIPHNVIVMGWVTLAMSSIIATMTPFDRWTAIAVCVSVALTYAVFSGFYGVVVTDFVQFFIAVGGMLILLFVAWNKVGGLDVMVQKISETPEFGEKTFSMFPDFASFDMDLLALFIFVFVLWWNDANGYIMQRMSSCKNEKHSVLATMFYATFQTSRIWLWAGVALVSIVLFPNLLHTPFGDTQAYPMVMNTYLGPGLKGLLVTAFLAAYMSTIDTHLNWGASYIMTDVYRRFVKKDATERHYMVVTKTVVVVLMLLAAAVVPFMTSVTMAWEILALLLAGQGIINFARWFWWRINAFTELTALLTAAALSIFNVVMLVGWPDLVMFGTPYAEIPFVLKLTVFMAVVVPLSLVVTFLTPPVPVETLETFYRKIRPGGAWGVLSPEVRNLPGNAFAFRTLVDVVGVLMVTFGISLGIGYWLFGNYVVMACCFAASCLGAVRVYMWYRREVLGTFEERQPGQA